LSRKKRGLRPSFFCPQSLCHKSLRINDLRGPPPPAAATPYQSTTYDKLDKQTLRVYYIHMKTISGFDADENEFLTMDGYDDCILGVVERFGIEPIICYDKNKVIGRLMDDGLTYDEALEFFEFNQIGAWVGEKTPCFITLNT
jgi:hypothetical protein